MLTDQRRNRLLEMVRTRGFASLSDLAGALDVSESTIRRDLDQLEESGSARRTHGGVFYTGPSPQLSHFQQRQEAQWEKKRQIARRAAELVEAGVPAKSALQAATRNAARAWRRTDFGTLEQGKSADILILEADPLEDPGHLNQLWRVIRKGEQLDPQALLASSRREH